ncbi:MAG: leucine-rich repeat domain-containing protein, partial [Asgard group archaeon]|nr:leucine-rich repeat domain-containing protein [Asgard group archaeon]
MSLEELEKKIVNYFNNNEMRKAEDFVKKMLHIDPKNPHVKMYLIMIKIETGHFSEALGLLSSLGKEAEKTKAYWKWLGLIKTGLNDIPEAINAYQKALELEPKYTDVYWLLLKLLEKFDLPAAIEYLYKAIRNIGYTKDFDVKLKKYQNLLARKKGIHAPIEMTISNNKGTIKIKNTPLGSITKIQELDKTSFILTELQLQHTNLEKIDGLDNLQHLTYLSLSYNNIEKIEGLERLHNLKNLYLYKNKISKIEGLEKLTNLETLELGYNNIEKIESLEKLQKLNKLCLNGNKIKSITGLEKLTALRTLKLYNNQIEKIKGLDTLENLETLSLGENKISDISGLEKLRNLKYLKLNKNEINSMDGIEKVPTLSKLNLKDNQLKMINHLDKLPLLERLELQGNTDLHSYLTNNPIIIKPQNFRNQRDSFKYSILMDCCGLTNEET